MERLLGVAAGLTIGAVPVIVLALIVQAALRRKYEGRCWNCRFDTQGLSSVRCPECGAHLQLTPAQRARLDLVGTYAGDERCERDRSIRWCVWASVPGVVLALYFPAALTPRLSGPLFILSLPAHFLSYMMWYSSLIVIVPITLLATMLALDWGGAFRRPGRARRALVITAWTAVCLGLCFSWVMLAWEGPQD